MGGVVDLITGDSGDDAADASVKAAKIQAESQKEALDYLKQIEKVPQQFRSESISTLGGLYGLRGGQGSQQELIDMARQSPLYSAILGGQQAGEEAILRQSAATGGLRSGNVQQALYDYNTQLQNQALLEAYNQQVSGLQSLAQLPSNANQIASLQAGIGQTQAQGITAAAQAQQTASQQQANLLLGAGGIAAGIFSDRTLKKNIKCIGKVKGHDWYEWDWNFVAEEELGLEGKSQGCMADEILETNPEAIIISDEGFMTINYFKLGIDNMPAQK